MKKITISCVIPVYNEQSGINNFHISLVKVLKKLNLDYEIIYVDDGSTDKSAEYLYNLEKSDNNIRPIYFSRNFGKEIATTAGIHAAAGNAILIIDADGQHPVELIPKFISNWQNGSKVVIGVRKSNNKEGMVKKYGSIIFYKTLKMLGAPDVIPGSTDFRLIDKEVANIFNKLTEHSRITRSLIDWVGFEKSFIEFEAKAREHGEASYSNKKLIVLAMNGFVSLSFTPLYLTGYLGAFITVLSFFATSFVLINEYLLGDPLVLNITGTAFLALFILFLVGILMIGQGLLALYIARIYTETQNRPLYITKKNKNLNA